ncbi:MAG: hypothetical protein NVS9B8_15900 [Candidatus Limnocylindrales bacterium]
MALVRTNITMPAETLALVDAVAGPRGRSRYIAEVVAKQVRRDNARLVFEKYAGALKGTNFWGKDDDEVLANLRELRDSSDRDRMLWAPYEESTTNAVPGGHDDAGRPRERASRSRRSRPGAVQRAE